MLRAWYWVTRDFMYLYLSLVLAFEIIMRRVPAGHSSGPAIDPSISKQHTRSWPSVVATMVVLGNTESSCV